VAQIEIGGDYWHTENHNTAMVNNFMKYHHHHQKDGYALEVHALATSVAGFLEEGSLSKNNDFPGRQSAWKQSRDPRFAIQKIVALLESPTVMRYDSH
jgi:hypothetical protein